MTNKQRTALEKAKTKFDMAWALDNIDGGKRCVFDMSIYTKAELQQQKQQMLGGAL